MVKIRQASIDDLLEVTDMWLAMRKETMPDMMETDGKERDRFIIMTVARLYDSSWFILIAEKDDAVVGFILGEIQVMEYTDIQSGFCECVYVRPEFRTKGIGPKLVDDLYTRFKKSGCKLTEFVTNYSPRLIKRWQKKGWQLASMSYKKEV